MDLEDCNMKNATIQISYPSEKLDAIRQYTGKKDVDMTAEMQDALTKLYEKHVPRDVREFLEAREAAQAEKPPRPARQAPAAHPENSGNDDA